MASRILHLAAAKLILDEHPVADEKRFRLGSILPDAGERVSAHFRVRIDGGTKTMMALSGFRARFADKMDDPLYLGYYLHLVQDIVFRKVFYLDHYQCEYTDRPSCFGNGYVEMLGYQGEDSDDSHFGIDDSEDSRGEDEYEQSARTGFQFTYLFHNSVCSLITTLQRSEEGSETLVDRLRG